MRACIISGLVMGLSLAAVAGGGEAVKFTQPPSARRSENQVTIAFSVDRATDVEVAVMNAEGKVIRHLAAGVLGKNVPPPLKADSLAQQIEWDGRDDYGKKVPADTPLQVRVRAGMGVALRQIVGGDPYAYYSRQMGQGDHAAWRLTGLEAKPDGKVYVLGNANNYGPPALRQYDAAGNYVRTVYPPPAGLPLDAVKGWGVTVRADGTWTPQYADLSSPALSRTLIAGTRGRIATLVPSPDPKSLLLTYGFKLMRIHTDGTIPPAPALAGQLVNEPAVVSARRADGGVTGPMSICPAGDGKHFYLSGIFAADLGPRRRRVGAKTTGPWRDGQVFKVDYATRKAEVFFALDAERVPADLGARGRSPIADARYGPYAAVQGVAADADGNVFVCDRLNKRVLILDGEGKIRREIPVAYPDVVAVAPKSKALYVTTRRGHYHGKGELRLLKFDDWSKDATPSANVPLCEVRHFSQPTYLAAVESKDDTYVWAAYSALPVRVYRDKGASGLELVKDFQQVGAQRALDLQHIRVDPKTEHVYVADGFGSCFRLTDWSDPKFVRCMVSAETPLRAISLAMDVRNRRLYSRNDRSPVRRWRLDAEVLTLAPIGDSPNAFTPRLSNDWRIGLGKGDRGLAAAPDGSLATLGALGTAADYGGYLRYFDADPTLAPWQGLLFECFGKKVRAGGIRFDPRGNLYVGKFDATVHKPPAGFKQSSNFLRTTGRIYKFAPTGSLEAGNLFPTAPEAPAKIYDVHFGALGPKFARTPRFGVDAFGRIYYPTSLLPQVSVIDNEGNPILRFGTYGNRDSAGGLAGDLVPTKDVPMAWPNSVDATDDFIYVSDIVNIRLLRLAKTFAAAETVGIK